MDEQPQQSDSTNAALTLSVLGRTFLSADDAACYAHERVGRRRNRGYYGYILQRNDQRYVITELVEQAASSTTHHELVPDNHVLHSRFFSHPALSTLDAHEVADLEWSVEDAATSLLMFSVKELRNILGTDLPAYLSGAEDSLIRFTPDGSPASLALLKQLGTTESPGKLALDLEQGVVKPEQLVTEAAAAGDLQVIISNGRWRPRGKVTEHFVPGSWERTVPERVSLGAVFQSADEAALDRYARNTVQRDEGQTWFGFILKHKDKEDYVASERVPVSFPRDRLFLERSLFRRSPKSGEYVYPESFIPHSYFYSRQRVNNERDAPRRWLAEHFIVPKDLWVAVYNAKKRPVFGERVPALLYVSTPDGALLKYVPRPDTPLFDNDVPNMGLEAIQNNLATGVSSATDFIVTVARNDALQVLRTSVCWDRKGLVGPNWAPNQNLQRRPLGPVFLTADDAVVHARTQVPAGVARAFGGLILQRSDGRYVATDPVDIPQEDFDIKWVFADAAVELGQFPPDCTIVARYRSRVLRALPVLLSDVDKELYRNMLSVDSVYTAFMSRTRALDEYLFAPDGSIIRYRIGTWERIRADLGIAISMSGKPARDLDATWIKEQIHAGTLTPTAWVKKLVNSGYLKVVAGSRLWGPSREVTEFEPYQTIAHTTDYPRALVGPAYSAVCIQEQDAARLAHEQAGSRTLLGFGFILRNARDGSFLATLPVGVRNSRLAYDRVFPGVLPYRYVDSGLIMCAAATPLGLSDDDYRHFFSPLDVSMARDSVRTPQGYRPIYFSCGDGALLRLELAPFDPRVTLDRFGQVEIRDNPFATNAQAQRDQDAINRGTFTLTNYIRRMAAAGKLEVLLTSAYWSRPGEVGQDWLAGMPSVSVEARWTSKSRLPFGPVFHHPDDAARYAQLRAARFNIGLACTSAILAKPDTYSYVGMEPLAGTRHPEDAIKLIFRTASDVSASPGTRLPRLPDGYKWMASHQIVQSDAQPGSNADADNANFASPESIHSHTQVLKNRGFEITAFYYSTRDGALLKYVPTYSIAEQALLAVKLVQPPNDQWSTVLSFDAFISRLANNSNLEVLKAAGYWRQAGRLGADWKVIRTYFPDVPVQHPRDEL
ncbi:hypothetical protein J2Y74_000475 [Pseudomonas migulae]|uniref:hypothetical protein n=1 Tax=Pseudomonas migulae TaxID=78543 RepID=UPI0020A15386|nr:hypothetical protein [Pseudomonas migulae]MCP1516165.1 hypothetical protein [Pseudomonas migulae]